MSLQRVSQARSLSELAQAVRESNRLFQVSNGSAQTVATRNLGQLGLSVLQRKEIMAAFRNDPVLAEQFIGLDIEDREMIEAFLEDNVPGIIF
jgi:hypothetical protein